MIRGLDFESGGLGFNPQSKKNAEHQFSLNIGEWFLESKKFGVRTTCELQVSLIEPLSCLLRIFIATFFFMYFARI